MMVTLRHQHRVRRGTRLSEIGRSITNGIWKSLSKGSTINVVPRLLTKNPAMPNQRSVVSFDASNAALPTAVLGARA